MYVNKCGVRKNWKQELKGLSTAESIERIKQILESIGIKGRPSLIQCKAIKEKLDLKKELEDILPSNEIYSNNLEAEESELEVIIVKKVGVAN